MDVFRRRKTKSLTLIEPGYLNNVKHRGGGWIHPSVFFQVFLVSGTPKHVQYLTYINRIYVMTSKWAVQPKMGHNSAKNRRGAEIVQCLFSIFFHTIHFKTCLVWYIHQSNSCYAFYVVFNPIIVIVNMCFC